MRLLHRREHIAQPHHPDKVIVLWLKNGTCEEITMKISLYKHFKKSLQEAFAGKFGQITLHGENGHVFHHTYSEIRRDYTRIIQYK